MSEKMLFANINDVKSVDKKERIIEFIATKEIRDYDNDIVSVEGMDISKIKKNKSFLWSHQFESPPIGKITKIWKDGKTIKGQAQMTSEEEYSFGFTIYKLIDGGYINNVSVSFIPDYKTMEYKEGKDGVSTRVINNATMLEISAVNVGANNATTLEAKSLQSEVNKALDDGILNDNEFTELEEFLEFDIELEQKEIIPETDEVNLEKVIEEKDIRIAELELQLQEQEMNEDIDEFDNYLGEVFDEFNSDGNTQTEIEGNDEDWIAEALEELE